MVEVTVIVASKMLIMVTVICDSSGVSGNFIGGFDGDRCD